MGRKWKKIILVFGVIFLLVFSFWYGGNSAGLQGFSATDGQGTIRQEKEDGGNLTVKDTQKEEQSTTEEKNQKESDNIFKQIVMNITKKSSSSDTSKNTQNNKKAQKNANRAVDKRKKEEKKKKRNLPVLQKIRRIREAVKTMKMTAIILGKIRKVQTRIRIPMIQRRSVIQYRSWIP